MLFLHLLGLFLFIFGIIGLIRPTHLHQMIVIQKFSLEKRWGNLILVILGLAMLYSMIVDFMYVFGMVIFLFGLIGLIYPTPVHQAVTFRKFSLGNRWWNLLFIACSILIMVVFSTQLLGSTISDKPKAGPIEVIVQKLKDLGQEGQLKLAELAGLLNDPEVAHKKIETTPTKPAKPQIPVAATVPSAPAFKGTNVTCADFPSSEDATAYMKAYNVKKLDRDGDGIACEASEPGNSTNGSGNGTSGPGNSTHVTTVTPNHPTDPFYRGTNVTCADFSSSTEATNYMYAYGVYKLDRDGDGIACESLGSEEVEYPEWETPEPDYFPPGSPEADPPPEGAPDDPGYVEPDPSPQPEYNDPNQSQSVPGYSGQATGDEVQ